MLSRRTLLRTAAAGILMPAAAQAGIITQSGSRLFVAQAEAGTLAAQFKVTSGVTGTQPFTFGHCFRQGEVPEGQYVTSADAASFQCDIRNRWPDGSAKYGVISALASFTADVQKTFNLAATGSAPGGSDVAEPTTLDAEVTFTSGVTGTYALQDLLGVDRSTWSKADGGRVRSIPGPVMSEFHYYCPTSDAHVAVWWYVRAYSTGAIEVETVVENGWLNVSSPATKSYGVTVDVNGSERYSGSLTHYHHTRWSRVDWYDTDPECVPQHDAAYLRATRMVPNYAVTNSSEDAYGGMASALNPTPFALGNWSATMGNAGYQAPIGLLPQWEAVYCCESDPRAYVATISNQRGSGRWPIHYRDETTGRPVIASSYTSMSFASWGNAPPTASGAPGWDIPHHPSTGYLPYLLEGRWPQLESIQFTGIYALMDSNPSTRKNAAGSTGLSLACINSPLTTRGYAWAVRSMGEAAAITPTKLAGSNPPTADANLRTSLVNCVEHSAGWAKARYIDGSIDSGTHQNTIGWIGHYDSYSAGTSWWGGSWMHAFQGMAWGHLAELEIEGVTQATVEAVRNFVALNSVLQGNASDTDWNWRRMATYDKPYLKSSSTPSSPVFMTPQEQYTEYKSAKSLGSLTFAAGSSLKAHSSNTDIAGSDSSAYGVGYGALHASVLAIAIDAGVSGAQAAYDLVTGASNFARTDADDAPQFCLAPRAA